MQGLHFTSNNHFLGSYWGMCSTKTKRDEPRRRKAWEAGGRQRQRDAQHDGEGPAGLQRGQLQLGVNKDSRGCQQENTNLKWPLTASDCAEKHFKLL